MNITYIAIGFIFVVIAAMVGYRMYTNHQRRARAAARQAIRETVPETDSYQPVAAPFAPYLDKDDRSAPVPLSELYPDRRISPSPVEDEPDDDLTMPVFNDTPSDPEPEAFTGGGGTFGGGGSSGSWIDKAPEPEAPSEPDPEPDDTSTDNSSSDDTSSDDSSSDSSDMSSDSGSTDN